MAKKSTHGGKRKGAGRKPSGDPKIAVFMYLAESVINSVGGREAAKIIGEKAVLKRSLLQNKS